MTTLKVSDLSIHPKNEYYFDDMSGEKWDQFLKSVKNNGVRTPIIVTDDMRVVSGNQRIRACRELGISVINAEIEHYANEDDVIRDLIEINIRQRGAIDDSEIKQARRITFLQGYYGIKQGGDRKPKPNNSVLKTQSDLAEELGMSVDTLQNYAKLTELIPEMQDLVDTGIVTKTVALSVLKQLSPEEQKQLAEQISGKEKVSQREIDFYTRRIKELSDENNALKARKPEVREIVKEVEVVPDDYDSLKKKAKQADAYRKDFDNERQKTADERRKNLELQDRIAELEQRSASGELHTRVVEGSLMFISGCGGFLRDYGGYVWIAEHLNELNQTEQENYKKAVESVYAWSQNLLEAIKRERSMNNE